MKVEAQASQFSNFFSMLAVLPTLTFSAYLHTTATDRIIWDYQLK
jgi:hypothetical protein